MFSRLITTVLLGLLLALFSRPAAAQELLAIHHIDVDQGDATLVVAPNGRTLLIDAGLTGRGDTVARFLRQRGIDTVDAVLATHYDRDHYGGLPRVAEAGITIEAWYDRGGKAFLPESKTDDDGDEYDRYVAAAESPKQLLPGDSIRLDSAVSIVAVASNGHVRGAVGKYDIDSLEENGYSVAALINYRGFNYFAGGDLTRPVEERIVREAAVGDVDVYHVNHHGSATSSSHAFLQAIRPEVAVISSGSHGLFHHPRQAVLDTLQLVKGIEVYQTNRLQDEDLGGVGGNVSEEFIADLDADGADGTISVVVGRDSFTVHLPARGIRRSYPIER